MDPEYPFIAADAPDELKVEEFSVDELINLMHQAEARAVVHAAAKDHHADEEWLYRKAHAAITSELARRQVTMQHAPRVARTVVSTPAVEPSIEIPSKGQGNKSVLEGQVRTTGRLGEVTRAAILDTLAETGGRRGQAAAILGISKRNLTRIITELKAIGIEVPASTWTHDENRKEDHKIELVRS